MHRVTLIGLVLGLGLGAGCGGSSKSSAPAPSCSGSTPVALTVQNYLSWCAVSVAGDAATTNATQTVCVADGAVPLTATAESGFELGPAPWHLTDGDHGSGDPGSVTGSGQSAVSATTITVSGSTACAWVCCPFTNGTGCPTSNQCAVAPTPSPY